MTLTPSRRGELRQRYPGSFVGERAVPVATAPHAESAPYARGAVLFAPAVDLPHRFAAAGSARAMECAVLRPIDLTRTHGVKVAAEEIAAMAKAYDPTFEAGALNFDHAWGGPSHGLASRIWLDGELLWCRMEKLSDEALAGISSGQWPRRSSEFWMEHPQTGSPYWCGLALLGSATPAVPGLPPAVLLSQQRPIYRLLSTGSIVAQAARDKEPSRLQREVNLAREERDRERADLARETGAAVAPPRPRVTPEQSRLNGRNGISAARSADLRRRYPGSFAEGQR